MSKLIGVKKTDGETVRKFSEAMSEVIPEAVQIYRDSKEPKAVVLVLEGEDRWHIYSCHPDAAAKAVLDGWGDLGPAARECAAALVTPTDEGCFWLFGAFRAGLVGAVQFRWRNWLNDHMN